MINRIYQMVLVLVLMMIPVISAQAQTLEQHLDALEELSDEASVTKMAVARGSGDGYLVREAEMWLDVANEVLSNPFYDLAAETDDRRALLPGSISARDVPFPVTDRLLRGVVAEIDSLIAVGRTNPFRRNARQLLTTTIQQQIREIRDFLVKERYWFDSDYELELLGKQ